jgi:DNA-binding SARP family transcriptional activator
MAVLKATNIAPDRRRIEIRQLEDGYGHHHPDFQNEAIVALRGQTAKKYSPRSRKRRRNKYNCVLIYLHVKVEFGNFGLFTRRKLEACSGASFGGRVMQVSVEFLGRTRVSSQGGELRLSRQSISFLAYLVLHRQLDLPREVMIEHFWSSHEPTRARSCLGTALSRLRKALQVEGHDWLELSPRGEPRISPSAPIWFDIVAFEAGIGPSLIAPPGALAPPVFDNLAGALTHYRGDLLLGWYDNWVLIERERLRLLCLRGHRRLMEHYAAIGDVDNALAAGHSALRIEPMQELVQQRVIELYYISGQRAVAIRQYERFAEILKNEMGISPSRNTRALIDGIHAERSLPPGPRGDRNPSSWSGFSSNGVC